MRPICFISDYGLSGELAGICRGVMVGIAPGVSIIDVSHSFHGRDVFSPVAAHLAFGAGLDDLGADVAPASLSPIDFPVARKDGDGLVAEIIDIDSFGNARLSATARDLDLDYGTQVEVSVRDETMEATYVQTFGASDTGDLVLLMDSHWRLSLAVNRGNASRALLLSTGDGVRIQRTEDGSSP